MATVAIVGAGPSGCFVAQALLKAMPGVEVDILDRLPVPYGLIRYGVAPDHQGTKAVIRQFERLFERQGVQFFGGVTLGNDLSLDDLREMYDAVVLATGLGADRQLGVPGDDLPGVCGSGAVTRAINDHPFAAPVLPEFGRRVVIVGNGNVALDLARVLAKSADEFEGSDLSPSREKGLAGVESIEVIGRSPATQARFDPVMLRELGRLSDVRISVVDAQGEGKVIEALAAIDGHAPENAARTLTFRFGWTPLRLTGRDRLESAGFTASDGSGALLSLPCDSVLTAIGFDDQADRNRAELLANATGDGFLAQGLYAAGWFRRGPRGTIPDSRADAQIVAARLAADLDGKADPKPGRAALARHLSRSISYADWQRIDAVERSDCPQGRCRQKIPTLSRMLEIAQAGDP